MNLSTSNTTTSSPSERNRLLTAPDTRSYFMIAQGVAIPTIACIGIIGNTLNIVVLSTARGRRMASRSCLFALAIADLMFLIFGTYEIASEPFATKQSRSEFRNFYYSTVLVCRMTSSASLKSSILFVMVFNLERYISVCHPMQMHKMFKGSVERNLLIFSAFFCTIISMHYPISFVVTKLDDDTNNNSSTTGGHRMIQYRGPMYESLENAISYFDLVTFNFIPIVILAYLNLKLITTLRRVARKESDCIKQSMLLTHHHKVRKPSLLAANSILFAVIILFLLCYGPQIPARILTYVHGLHADVVRVYMAITNQLVFLNASLNFCLYCLVSKRYRSILRYMGQRVVACLKCEEDAKLCGSCFECPILSWTQMQNLSGRDVLHIACDEPSDDDL